MDEIISPEALASINAARLQELEALRNDYAAESMPSTPAGLVEVDDHPGLISPFDPCGGPESWRRRVTPPMTEGISERPGEGASGEILTAALQPGGVTYSGRLVNSKNDKERFWIHNWRLLVPFPPAPPQSELQFRLGVTAVAHLRQATLTKGGIWMFASVGVTPDVNVPIDQFTAASGFPLIAALPANSAYFAGELPLSGRFRASAGRTPAIGLVGGTVVSVQGGEVDFFWGAIGVHRRIATGSALPFEAYGMVEYRFCGDLVLDPG